MSRYLNYSCGCQFVNLDGVDEIKMVHACDMHKQQIIDDVFGVDGQ